MKNSLRKFLATASIAALGIAGFANVVRANEETVSASVPASCSVNFTLGDITKTASSISADASLDYSCNTPGVTFSESSKFAYSGPVSDNILGFVDVSTGSYINDDTDTTTVIGDFGAAVDNIATNKPGETVNEGDITIEIKTKDTAEVIPAGNYEVTKTVTVVPN